MESTPPTVSSTAPLGPAERARLRDLAHHSHAVILRDQNRSGAYPAAPTFSAYTGYAWLRDGSFIVEGMSRYGDVASADRFHDWVRGVLVARRGQVAELVAERVAGSLTPVERMLPTRFTLAGAEGADPWCDFQTDGYGMWLWAVTVHAERHGLDVTRWRDGVEVAVDYLLSSWDRPCFDWWEEHVEHRHVSTLGAIHGGLVAAAGSGLLAGDRADAAATAASAIRELVLAEGVVDGHLTKWLGTAAVDGSLPSCVVPFGLVEVGSELAAGTLAKVADDLDVNGGVHRFRADVFYGGGQWPLLSALLGWNLAVAGDRDRALGYLRWIAEQADERSDLPEQVGHHLLAPQTRAEWVERWGEIALPLLWSHGMYLILAHELGVLDERA